MHKTIRNMIMAGFTLSAVLAASGSWATTFTGTVFYTLFTGGQNVNKIAFTYDDAGAGTLTLGSTVNLTSVSGADGIIFRGNGNLLVGGQGNPVVHEIKPSTGELVTDHGTAGSASFHLALDPGGAKVWTSDFGGPLVEVPFGGGAMIHALSGDDTGVTGLSFAPNGNVFYVNGSPNGNGTVGLIDLTTFTTTRLFTGGITSAHGMVYAPFSDRMVLFGAGFVGSFAIDGTDLQQFDVPGVNDFDQGAVDGKGHALIAGDGAITLVDYLTSGEITDSTNHSFVQRGFTLTASMT